MNDLSVVDKIMELTGNQGVDVAIEAVEIPTTFEICQYIVVLEAQSIPANKQVYSQMVGKEPSGRHTRTVVTRI